jgi:cyclohexanone monooxygenase
MIYSFGFDEEIMQEWQWKDRYAYQPEILRYLNYVTDKLNLRPLMRFNCSVTGAIWDESIKQWKISLSSGEEYLATFVISATGSLSHSKGPHFDGLEKFKGTVINSGKWSKEIQVEHFKGKRVAVIGTGSSGVQMIPAIAKEAGTLYVVQRRARFVLPTNQRPISKEEEMTIKSNYMKFKEDHFHTVLGIKFTKSHVCPKLDTEEEFNQHLEDLYQKDGGLYFVGAYLDLVIDPECNRMVGDFLRKKIRQIVKDPKVAEALCPSRDLMLLVLRISIEDNYFETFNRENVKLLPVPHSTISFDENHLQIDQEKYPVDFVVLATGFVSVFGALININFQGLNGIKLSEKWADITDNYLGLTVPQFPNLFMINGPGSPNILTVMTYSIEQHINFCADIIQFMKSKNYQKIDVSQATADTWVQYTSAITDTMLFKMVRSNYNINLKGEIGYVHSCPGLDNYTKKTPRSKRSRLERIYILLASPSEE